MTRWHTGLLITVLGCFLWTELAPGANGVPVAEGVTSRSDFNGDGYADLAVGRNGEIVNVIYGSAIGLRSAHNQAWSQNSPGIQGVTGEDEHFGGSPARGTLTAMVSPIWRWVCPVKMR